MASSMSAPAAVAIDYPSSDGKPMAESDAQRIPLTYAVDALRHYFRSDPDVYVSGNLLIYYEEGNPKRRVAPDVFVVFGARAGVRPSYKLWEEPKAPDFVLEITSPKTWRQDQTAKRELYRRLGVQEYWQYDPTGDYLEPPLQGLALVAGEYEPLPALRSAVLGLELRLVDQGLRFHDPRTGEDLPDLTESEDKRAAAEARAEQEAEGRRQEAEGRRQEAEGRRREAEGRRREVAARQAAEARLAELEALHRGRDLD